MTPQNQWILLAVLVVVIQAVPAILASTTRSSTWDAVKSASQPPGAAFATVWPVLYLCLAAALWLLSVRPDAGATPYMQWVAVGLLAAQLVLNFAWLPVYGQGTQKAARQGTWLIVAMVALGLPAMVLATRVNIWAAALIAPYLAWLCFASVMSADINTQFSNAAAVAVAA